MDTIDGMAGLLFAYFSLLPDKYNLYLFWENKGPNMKNLFQPEGCAQLLSLYYHILQQVYHQPNQDQGCSICYTQ